MTPDPISEPQLDPQETRAWLELHYGTFPPEGHLSVLAINREPNAAGNVRSVLWGTTDQLDHLTTLIHQKAPTCDVWLGAATRTQRLEGRRGGAEDCHQLPGMWIDVDIAGPGHADSTHLPADLPAALALVNTFPLPPTAIVHTGGGVHAWWLFAEPVDMDEGAPLLRRWEHRWQQAARVNKLAIDAVSDPARIMRIPGTVNRKPGIPPRPVYVLDGNKGARYGADDILELCPDPPPAPVVQLQHHRVDYGGTERPGSAFDAARTCQDVLATTNHFTPLQRSPRGEHHYHYKDAANDTSLVVYEDDGHATIYSDTAARGIPGAKKHYPYTPFGLYALLHHGNDFSAAARALREAGYGSSADPDDLSWITDRLNRLDQRIDAVTPPDDRGDLLPTPIDWPTFWAKDHTAEDWLVEPLLPMGRMTAVWAARKAGKSLLSLEVAAALATGRPILGRRRSQSVHVAYFDLEMTEADLYERLEDMGYGPEDTLTHLHYYLLPSLPPLDTAEGGAAIEAIVHRDQATVAVFDTMARVVQGDENESTTYRAFYQHTGLRLKMAGVTGLRLDHSGKDPLKDARGSSAKGDDIDLGWELRIGDDGAVILTRKLSRVSWVPASVTLRRHDEPLRHTLANGRAWPAGTSDVVEALERLGVPVTASYSSANTALKADGDGCRKQLLLAALKYRREAAEDASWTGSGGSGTGTPENTPELAPGTSRPETQNRRSEAVPGTPEPVGTGEPCPVVPGSAPLGAEPVRDPRPGEVLFGCPIDELDPTGDAP